jgi:hypothetical protein
MKVTGLCHCWKLECRRQHAMRRLSKKMSLVQPIEITQMSVLFSPELASSRLIRAMAQTIKEHVAVDSFGASRDALSCHKKVRSVY